MLKERDKKGRKETDRGGQKEKININKETKIEERD
jgi:hypothetical protein